MAKIHRWSLDETSGALVDSIGSADGTSSNTSSTPALFTNGRIADSLAGYIDVGDPADLQFTTGDFSLRLVIKINAEDATNYRKIVSRWDSAGGGNGYTLGITSTGFATPNALYLYNNSAVQLTSPALPVGEWLDCVVTRSGATYRCYVNGVLVDENLSGPASIVAYSGNTLLLNQAQFTDGAIDLIVDQIEIWDEELTAAYISEMLFPIIGISLVDLNPDNDARKVAVDTTVGLAIEAFDDLDTSTIIITIDGTVAYSGDAFQNSFTGSVTGPLTKKTFDITPPADFDYHKQIVVDVYAEDVGGLPLNESYSFYTDAQIEALTYVYGRRMDADTGVVALARCDEASDPPEDSTIFNLNCLNYGSAAGPVPPGSQVPFSRARAFNANDGDFFILDPAPYLHLTEFTVELWAMILTSFPDPPSFAGDPHAGYCLASGVGWGLFVRGLALLPTQQPAIYADIGGVKHEVLTTTELGVWYHYALTISPTELTISRDGELLYTGAGASLTYDINDPTAVGCKIAQGPVSTYHTRGYIADVRFSKYVRRADSFYNTKKALIDPQLLFNVEADSLAVYNFDDALETDDTVVDSTGGFHNGVSTGHTVGQTLVPGPYSTRSRHFNGGTKVVIPHSDDFSTNQPLTLECFYMPGTYVGAPPAYPPTSLPDQFRLLGKEDTGSFTKQFTLETDLSKQRLVFTITGDYSVSLISPPEVLMANYRSYYLACTFDPTTKTGRMYIDGTLVDEHTQPLLDPATAQTNNPLVIGTTQADLRHFTGLIHALRFSGVVKTAKQIYDTFHGSDIVEILS